MGERDLHRLRAATLEGKQTRARPRAEVAASWRRVSACGLEPGSDPGVPVLPEAEVERRRATSAMAPLVRSLTTSLESVTDAGQLVVLADADGRVLWRSGSSGVRRMADGLGFVGGSAWTEANVGTNAIGTALVLGEPVHIRGAEHYVESHTRWGCAAAPVADPWTGRTIGVVDVSGPAHTLHPAELALVAMAARLAGMEAVQAHQARLEQLRSHAAPLLARVGGRALVVDESGRTAAATGLAAPDRVSLPHGARGGAIWLPTLGAASMEPLPGGWLLRLGDGEIDTSTTRLVLDLRDQPLLRVDSATGSWEHHLSPRHAEIVLSLLLAARNGGGRTATELAEDLFDDTSRTVTVRAEMSRLRRVLGGLLCARPYRLAPDVDSGLRLPDAGAPVLPGSAAPVVARLRAGGPRLPAPR